MDPLPGLARHSHSAHRPSIHIDPLYLHHSGNLGLGDVFEFQPVQTAAPISIPNNTSWQYFPRDPDPRRENPRNEDFRWHGHVPHIYLEFTQPHPPDTMLQEGGMAPETEMARPQRTRSLSTSEAFRPSRIKRLVNWVEKKAAELEPVGSREFHSTHQDWHDLVADRESAFKKSQRVLPVRIRQYARELDELDRVSSKLKSSPQEIGRAANYALDRQRKVIDTLNLMDTRARRLSQFTAAKDAYILTADAEADERFRAALKAQEKQEEARRRQRHKQEEERRDIAYRQALVEASLQNEELIAQLERERATIAYNAQLAHDQEVAKHKRAQADFKDDYLLGIKKAEFTRQIARDTERSEYEKLLALNTFQQKMQEEDLLHAQNLRKLQIEGYKKSLEKQKAIDAVQNQNEALQKQWEDLHKKKPDDKK
jgi:hypothetical protein